MKSALENILARQIALHGPMDVGQFMNVALSHPRYGYYMKRDPLGRGGDFTTAPEVSQMFGEMIGLWAAEWWMRAGAPKEFIFLECGPGRGTLMADMLRAARQIPEFLSATHIHLLEISPALRARQKEALQGHGPVWHETLETVPNHAPMIVVANEFFDALAFRQLQKESGTWRERAVFHEEGRGFFFGLRPAGEAVIRLLPEEIFAAPEGAVFEFSPAREGFAAALAGRLKTQGGAGLVIDYGHAASAPGDTFQAMHAHRYCGVFEHIGDADLTSHVDFAALIRAAALPGIQAHGPVTQGAFLRDLGIEARAQALIRMNGAEKEAGIRNDLHRLISSDEMGDLFKVLCLSESHGAAVTPAGF